LEWAALDVIRRKGKIMEIGPLEYVVIGVPGQQLTSALISELNAIQESGQVCVVDLIFVTKTADGSVTMQEVNELIEKEPEVYGDIAGNLMGLLTAQDIEQLIGQIPPAASAFIILIEHTWVIGLTEAIRKGKGVVYSGGMVSHEVLALVSAELATGKEDKNA
jgi:hypothetical protein